MICVTVTLRKCSYAMVVGQAAWAAASYHAAARWKYWKVLVGRPTLRRGKSTGGRFGYPHRQSLGSIVYSCAHCTLSGCQTFSHSQERCICSPEFSEHSRMMVASESKHKRQNNSKVLLARQRTERWFLPSKTAQMLTRLQGLAARERETMHQQRLIYPHAWSKQRVGNLPCKCDVLHFQTALFFSLAGPAFHRFRA